MFLDLADWDLDIILVDFAAQRLTDGRRIGRPEHAERARRDDDDEIAGLSRRDRRVESAGQRLEEIALRLIVPIALLDRAACAAERLMHPAGLVRTLLMRRRTGVLAHFGLEYIHRPRSRGQGGASKSITSRRSACGASTVARETQPALLGLAQLDLLSLARRRRGRRRAIAIQVMSFHSNVPIIDLVAAVAIPPESRCATANSAGTAAADRSWGGRKVRPPAPPPRPSPRP